MPLYDYKCAGCGTLFEELVRSSSEESEVRCPKCGSATVSRQVSSFALGGGSSAERGSSASSFSGCSGRSCRSCSSKSCH